MTAEGWWGWHPDPVIRQAMAYGASQDADELAAALALVREARPRVVVEIGCDRGCTLYCWRQVCGRVYGITTADNSAESGGSGLPLDPRGAEVLTGDSHDRASLAWLVTRLWDRPGAGVDVLVIDGDHSPAGVLADLGMYGPLVRARGLILLHDVTPSADPRSRVHEVWPELAARFESSVIANPDGGYGWGVIRVRPGDVFNEPVTAIRSADDE